MNVKEHRKSFVSIKVINNVLKYIIFDRKLKTKIKKMVNKFYFWSQLSNSCILD